MSKKSLTGVLLINLGTPDSPSVPDVRKYLREFLMDRRVIDIPFLNRFLLINFIIAPFRAPKSAKVYKELWSGSDGSPLLIYGLRLKQLLQETLGDAYQVAFGMRYQQPGLGPALDELKEKGVEKIIVVPLFPQYASASTGSAVEEVMRITGKWEVIPHLKFINKFFDHKLFISAFAQIGARYMSEEKYDHFIFTYHGLPERQILKASTKGYCQLNNSCCARYHSKNLYCYRAQCYETTRLLVKALDIPNDEFTVAFQSRLGKTPWIKPYTDEVIRELSSRGIKKVLAFSPSFIADCLETIIEGGVEYKELFEANRGEKWQLVESLNDHPMWVECIKNMVLET
jgi:ferrochelatase